MFYKIFLYASNGYSQQAIVLQNAKQTSGSTFDGHSLNKANLDKF